MDATQLARVLQAMPHKTTSPQPQRLHDVVTQLAHHLATHGAGLPPTHLRREVLESTLTAHLGHTMRGSDMESTCIASTESRRRRHTDLPQTTPFLIALQAVQAAFEADAIVCLIPRADGTFATDPQCCLHAQPCAPLTETQRLAYQVLAQATAILGVPLEINNRDEAHPNLCTHARHTLPGEESVFCIPLYQWPDDASAQLVAVLCLRRARLLPPPTELEWFRNLYLCTAPTLRPIPQAHHAAPLPMQISNTPLAWDGHVEILRHTAVPYLPPPRRTDRTKPPTWTIAQISELSLWLSALIQRLGLHEPESSLHPYAVKKQLARLSSAGAADQMSTTAETSAVSLSHTALEQGWRSSVRGMIEAVGQQFRRRHTVLTLFAGYQRRGQFFIADALAHPMDQRELHAYILLAQIGTLCGGSRYVPADDTSNPLYAIVRTILGVQRDLLLLPVYAWREPGETPAFHGYFLAVRHRTAPPPTALEWLQWQLFCQTMHTPLKTIADEVDAIHKPTPAVIRTNPLGRQK